MKAFFGALLLLCTLAHTLNAAGNLKHHGYFQKYIPKGVCQSGWTLYRNCRCYKFITQAATWTKANSECQRIAPTNSDPRSPPVTARHLAAPQNKQENDFLAGLTGGKNSWIGGFKFADGKTWGWTDGQQWKEEE